MPSIAHVVRDFSKLAVLLGGLRAMSDRVPDNGLQIVMFTHQDAGVWADMAAIVWGAGLQVTRRVVHRHGYNFRVKEGRLRQGTVLLVLLKRLQQQSVYRDELVQDGPAM